ncbi:MAG: hypothetical protein LBS41_04560 [Streptococcaceae bacterium]|nr:hypothetical protein [Streptococcaceae bacterium]
MTHDMLYELSLAPAKTMLDKGVITKKEFKKIKQFLIDKYQPTIPLLLGL